VTEVDEGEGYRLLEQKDVNTAGRMALANLSGAQQRGGLSNIDFGNLTFQLSAVAIADLTEIRNKVLTPRLKAIARFYQQLARANIGQYVAGGYSSSVGKTGSRQAISAAQLADPTTYTIEYKFMSKSKRQEIANLSMAIAARGTISRETIMRDLLESQNPDEEIARLDAEEAEALDPAIKLYRKASSLLLKADKTADKAEESRLRVEAQLMGTRAADIIKQRKAPPAGSQGQTGALPEAPRGNANALMPLLSGGNSGGRAPAQGGEDNGQ
jgi:hypothetical protein